MATRHSCCLPTTLFGLTSPPRGKARAKDTHQHLKILGSRTSPSQERKLAASREIQVLRIRVQKGIGDSGEPGLPLWLQIWLPSWLHNSQPARSTWDVGAEELCSVVLIKPTRIWDSF